MTTTEDIRRYLDAHGIDGAQAEPGWCAVEFRGGEVGIVHFDGRGNWGGAGAAPCVEVGFINGEMTAVTRDRLRRCGEFYSSDITRHVPLTLAPPAGRDLDDGTPQAEIAKAAAAFAMATLRLARADSSTQRAQWAEQVDRWSARLAELRPAPDAANPGR